MKLRALMACLLISCGLTVLRPHAYAGASDYTLDFDEATAVDPLENDSLAEEFVRQGRDPWTSYLSHLSGFSQVHWGLSFAGSAPLARNVSNPMVPASVLKLVTAASAFRNLGANARFENHFDATVDRASGTASHVQFTVSGDPTWGHEEYEDFDARMNKVISELKSSGVTRVMGDISVVSTRPELDQIARPSGWPNRWILQCMATMPSSFMMNGNCGTLKVLSLTKAQWTTPGMDLPIHLHLTPGSSNDLSIEAELDALNRTIGYTVSGKFKNPSSVFRGGAEDEKGYTSSVPVYSGTRWLKNLFLLALQKNKIAYSANGNAAGSDSISVDLSSLPLQQILKVAVEHSINGILDRLYFEIAHVLNLKSGSDASYALLKTVTDDESLLNGVQIFDGCGLDGDDRIRADTMMAFLEGMKSEPYFSEFLSTLAVAGEPGTLQHRLLPLKDRVFGKTGTINGIYNLVGYFKTSAQILEPFVVFSNSNSDASTVRSLIDHLVLEFAALNGGTTRGLMR